LAETKNLAVRVTVAQQRMEQYTRELLPLLESASAVAVASAGSGQVPIVSLLDTHRMLIDARMEYYRQLVEYHTALAELEQGIGVDVTSKQPVEVAHEK
jgi:hypothetical protein